MKIRFELIMTFPRLAWCAKIEKGSDTVNVRHGPWVETRDDCFFEGAWDGNFEEFRFDKAATFTGTGGRVANGSIMFCSSTHMLDRIQSIRVGDEFFISNSFACLLAQAGLEPDIDHPNYFFDFLNHYRAGITETEKKIYIDDKYYAILHDCENIVVDNDLTIKRLMKNNSSPPVDYADYVSFLEQTTKLIVNNAIHPARKKTFRPVTTISTGYDATAVSVLASRAGCTEAVSFRKSGSALGYVDDSGKVIADFLGLHTTEYERRDFINIKELPEPEFYLNPFIGQDITMLVMEGQLEGALLMTGRRGDACWTTAKSKIHPYFKSPTVLRMGGASLVDFRLRIGFIHLPLPYSGGLHAEAIYDITMSREMTPWRIGGNYDRPIARRIIEEAGVPRRLFGSYKKAAIWELFFYEQTPASKTDFDKFYRGEVLGKKGGNLHTKVTISIRNFTAKWTHKLETNALQRLNIDAIIPVHILDRLHALWGSKYSYGFHWALAHTMNRYEAHLNKDREASQRLIRTDQRQVQPHFPK